MATRAQILEKLLTDTNEAAKAFAQFGGNIAAVRMRIMVAAYSDAMAVLIDKLETDAAGRILASAANMQIQKAAVELTKQFTANAGSALAPMSAAGEAMATSIENTTATMRKLLTTTLVDDAAVKAFTDAALMYGSARAQKGVVNIAVAVGTSASDIVSDAILRFEGNKQDLISRLFSPEGIEHFRKRNSEMASWAKGMDGLAKTYVEELKSGKLDIATIRDKFKGELDSYIEKRKAFLKAGQQPSLFDDTALETKSITEVKRQILETHQDSVYRASEKALPADTKWVNAKNTGYPDNCIDAMNSDPMTLDEWRNAPFGLPRSPSRDCGIYCECILFPVTPSTETGADISDPEAAKL